MGVAQDFKTYFEGLHFYLVANSGGVARFKTDYISTDLPNIEVYYEIIVSLKNNFELPTQILIQDIYNVSNQIHDISQFQNIPVRTQRLFDYAYEKRI